MATTPTTTTTTPPSTPTIILNIDYLNESWCDLQYKSTCSSTGSISHLNHSVNPEVLEKLLQEAQRESQMTNTGILLLASPDTHATTSSPSTTTTTKVYACSPALPMPSQHAASNNNNNNKVVVTVASSSSRLDPATATLTAATCLDSSTTSTNTSTANTTANTSTSSSPTPPDNADAPPPPSSSFKENYINEENVEMEIVLDEVCADSDKSHTTQSNITINSSSIKKHKSRLSSCTNNNNKEETAKKSSADSGTIDNASSDDDDDEDECELSSCSHCLKRKRQIDALINKQLNTERQLIKLRREYEEKVLASSLLLTTSTTSNSSSNNGSRASSSATTSPPSLTSTTTTTQTTTTASATAAAVTSTYLNNNNNMNVNGDRRPINSDWTMYWSSRPQSNPPKEWNFVHPNSAKSKLNAQLMSSVKSDIKAACEEVSLAPVSSLPSSSSSSPSAASTSRWFSRDTIGKLIFTHMASFIVGATLMLIVLRRHLTPKGVIYFI